jgi:ribonuclease HI
MYNLQFDGLFRGFPGEEVTVSKAGFLCYGWIILRDETLIARGHGAYARGKDASSNIAEYLALIEGLDALTYLGVTEEIIQITGDAKCVIDQMQGLACVNSPNIKPLYRRAVRLADHFHYLIWEWTPRRNNRLADSLTRRALQQIRMDRKNLLSIASAACPADGRRENRRFFPVLDLRIYHEA